MPYSRSVLHLFLPMVFLAFGSERVTEGYAFLKAKMSATFSHLTTIPNNASSSSVSIMPTPGISRKLGQEKPASSGKQVLSKSDAGGITM